ncbi:MAG: hypothetical protein KF891_04595 [Rhizobacter sp.]|nr:hypothetical protein [Rhizobacter sp.]
MIGRRPPSPYAPAAPAWPLLLAVLAFGAVEWLALWRSRAADRWARRTAHRP